MTRWVSRVISSPRSVYFSGFPRPLARFGVPHRPEDFTQFFGGMLQIGDDMTRISELRLVHVKNASEDLTVSLLSVTFVFFRWHVYSEPWIRGTIHVSPTTTKLPGNERFKPDGEAALILAERIKKHKSLSILNLH